MTEADDNLFEAAARAGADRVRAAFPNGIATDNARATIASAAPDLHDPAAAAIAEDDPAALAAAEALCEALADDDLETGVVIVAPDGAPFPGRLVWDAVYSAGFTWGDGDFFYWLPTPTSDPAQAIGVATSSAPGYFLPERLAPVDDLELTFDVPAVTQPTRVFDLLVAAATYLAGRLGGELVAREGTAFDATAERARVAAIEARMRDAGVVPGSGPALSSW